MAAASFPCFIDVMCKDPIVIFDVLKDKSQNSFDQSF